MSDSKEPASKVRPTVKELILKAVGDFPEGVAAGEVIDIVTAETDIAVSTIRQALRELEFDKKVINFREPPQKDGRPRNIYRLLEFESTARDTIIRDTVEEQHELEDQQLLRELVRESSGSYPGPGKSLRIYGEAATRLLQKDPIELYCNMADWLEVQFHKEIDEWTKAAGDRESRENHRKMLEWIVGLNEHVFFRTLGVPVEIRDDTGKIVGPGPVALVLDRNNMKSKYPPKLVNRQALKQYLQQSVFGAAVLERVPLEKLEGPLRLGGSDSSAQPIDLSGILPWQTEGRALSVVTSVGVRYDVYEKTTQTERHPEPKVLAQYERKKAIEEGLLIPPEAEPSLELGRGMMARVREAALDLRQYVKDHELLFEREPAVKIHFRDGRIFPLEHRFGDAVDYGLHGELVRSALRKFRTIINNVTAAEGDVMFCGFVKRTFFDMVSYLIHWYIGFGSAVDPGGPIDPSMKLEDLFRGGTDSSTLAYVFSALNKADHNIYVTFRIVRRFQSLQEEFIAETPPTTSVATWRQRLDNHSAFMSVRGIPPDALDVYSSLLARSSILMFYTSISAYDPEYERHISIPRIEITLPYTEIDEYNLHTSNPSTQDGLLKREGHFVRTIVSVLFHEKGGILEKYEEDLFPFQTNSPKVFLVPKPVNDAHVASKEIARVYAQDFEALLVREAKKYWHDLTATGASRS